MVGRVVESRENLAAGKSVLKNWSRRANCMPDLFFFIPVLVFSVFTEPECGPFTTTHIGLRNGSSSETRSG